ncbi:RNA polymerase sigma factor [Planococcus kocurii]|uniref:RNA polymerase sigma factor n=1 Tax=Planococcus kocurii TaxID=1374 RepID=UPI003AAD7157
MQDAIVKALNSIDRLDDINYLKTWFYRIVINTSIDFIQKNKRSIEKKPNSPLRIRLFFLLSYVRRRVNSV